MAVEKEFPLEIKIKGQPGLHSYKDVKDLVVKIGENYYYKHDDDLVKVPNGEDKIRFFRKDSPYLILMPNGEYVHKMNCIKTEDGVYFKKNDTENICQVNGKYVRKVYCFAYEGNWYLKTDPNFFYCHKVGQYDKKKNGIVLNEKFYGSGMFHGSFKDHVITTVRGELILKRDSISIVNSSTGETEIYFANSKSYPALQNQQVFLEFQDKTNPQEGRIVFANATKADFESNFTPVDLTNGSGPIVYVHKINLDYVKNCIEEFIMPRYSTKMEEIRKSINKNYSDLDPNENNAKVFKVINENWAGKSDIYVPENYGGYINKLGGSKANTFSFTGGLKYSFGVEFETSQGLLSNTVLTNTRLKAVGDRSIGAAEYVTLPMEGDAGIEMLKKQCEELAKATLVDDRCGLHVHVGGLSKETKPSFGKQFNKNAINLGCLIEEELYRTMPPNRIPTLYHCHSIRRFGPVTDDNFPERMGAFIFGEKEKWIDSKGNPVTPFTFSKYKLNESRNSHSSVGTWADGRYKWLNLIHSFLDHGPKTIEFRIFPGTTCFEKVYAYLLLSMAFTHVIDNEPGLIRKGVEIDDIFVATFKKYPKIRDFVIDFYNERKTRFNRKNIYPNHESLTFLK